MTTPETHAGRPIVVGIDGSEVAAHAVRWAASFAQRVHAPLRLVHAMPPIQPYIGELMISTSAQLTDEMRARGTGLLDAASAAAVDKQPDLAVDTVITDLELAQYVREASADVQLVVLGSRRSGAVRDLVLGGENIRVLNHASCPVLLWRDAISPPPTSVLPVVVGIDDSPSASHALVTAFDYASALGAPLIVGHFWQIGVVGVGYGTGLLDREKLAERETAWLHSHVEPLRDKYPALDVAAICYEASPAAALQSLSTSASMVVVGTRGHGKLVGAALGSVSQNLAHHSDCSVLVVH